MEVLGVHGRRIEHTFLSNLCVYDIHTSCGVCDLEVKLCARDNICGPCIVDVVDRPVLDEQSPIRPVYGEIVRLNSVMPLDECREAFEQRGGAVNCTGPVRGTIPLASVECLRDGQTECTASIQTTHP